MFDALLDIAKKFSKLDRNTIVKKALSNKDLQQLMIYRNTNYQLFEEGIDADGKSLGVYSKRTIEIKKEKGQPYNRVTLKDTGQFYASFEFENEDDQFAFSAQTEKDDKDLAEVYGEKIIGLTDESLFYLRRPILDEVVEVTRKDTLE